MSVHLETGGQAVIEGAWSMNALETRFQITDGAVFAKELMHALNREDEQGTTPIHRMCDKAIEYAIDQGAEGIEEHPEQEV